MNHERSIVSIKQIHHRALKDISEVLEYSNKFQSSRLLPKGVYSKDDCGKLKK